MRSRSIGLTLGVSELLAILQSFDEEYGIESLNSLNRVCKLLWCNSIEQRREFDFIWEKLLFDLTSIPSSKPTSRNVDRPNLKVPPPKPVNELLSPPDPRKTETTAVENNQQWKALPIQAPFVPLAINGEQELQSYTPISRREMVYAWKFLRRLLPDGPENILDIKATITEAANKGVYLSPIYRRTKRNHARIIFFCDQNGSMVPFHYLTRELIETAKYESAIEQIDVYYFNNTPPSFQASTNHLQFYLYLDPKLTESIEIESALEHCSGDTSLLVISDAGAARGHRNFKRIRLIANFLAELRKKSSLIAWLNPMPNKRWTNSSAQIISKFVPMFQADPDGLGNAIDIIRGQAWLRY